MNPKIKQSIIALGLISFAVLITFSFKLFSQKTKKGKPQIREQVVEVQTATYSQPTISIKTSGRVIPAKQLTIIPEISGKVIYKNPNFVPGSKITKGEILYRIDDRQYRWMLKQQVSNRKQAEVNLQLEKAKQIVARKELALLGQSKQDMNKNLILREPQLAAAQQSLESAQSVIEQAKLNVDRTIIRAPYTALVLEKQVDIGQVVSPGTIMGSLIYHDELWVEVSVPLNKLLHLTIPTDEHHKGSLADITYSQGGQILTHKKGSIIQLKTQLDQATHMAVLIVSITNPFTVEQGSLPLLPGTYVDVTLHGQPVPNGIKIPRVAVSGDNTVWVVDNESTIHPRDLQVVHRDNDFIIVDKGLEQNEQYVISPLTLPVPNMPVTIKKAPLVSVSDSATSAP